MHIRKGDTVRIMTGRDRGKQGRILRVSHKHSKLVVEGLNIVKKHSRPKKQGAKGEIVELAAPMSVAKVQLVCPQCKKATRVGYDVREKEKRRICKKCKSLI